MHFEGWGNDWFDFTAPYSLADGNWHQVALTYDGASSMAAYADGQQIGTASIGTQSTTTSGSQLQLGASFAGSLDEAAVYSSALSPGRVNAHWQSGSGVSCPSAPTSAYASAVLADAPIRYFSLDESSGRTALDYSGNCRPAAYNYSTGHVAGVLGGDKAASSPNGGGNALSESPDGLPSGAAARTIEAWVKYSPACSCTVLDYGSTSQSRWFELLVNGTNVHFDSWGNNADFTAPYSLADGNWHQVALTYDGGSGLKAFADGQQLGSATIGVLNTDNNVPFNVTWAGSTDDVSIYGAALSGARINAHWRAGVSVSCPAVPTTGYGGAVLADAPIRYFSLDESSGRAALDYSGNCRPAAYNYAAGHVSGALGGDSGASSPTGGGNTLGVSLDGLPVGAAARSFEAWVKNSPACSCAVLYYGSTNQSSWFELLVNGTNVHFDSWGNNADFTAPYSLADGNWHQVALTYDGGSGMKAFADGQQVGSATIGALSTNNNQPFIVSSPGSIDDVSIYGAALSAARVNAHWRAGVSASCPAVPTSGYGGAVAADAPIRYLRLNEAGGRSALDYSGNCRAAAFGPGVGHGLGAIVSAVSGAASSPTGGGNILGVSLESVPVGAAARTVEVWIKSSAACSCTVLYYGSTSQSRWFELLVNGTNVHFDSWGNNADFTAPYSLADGNWHQVALTYDGGSGLKAFADGQQLGSATIGVLNTDNNLPFDVSWWGSVSEVSIYPTALSPGRISTHYSAGAPIGGPFVGSQTLGHQNFCYSCWAKNHQSFHAAPVDASSGNMEHDFTDIAISGRSYPLAVTRTYNSAAASTSGPFGYGWSANNQMSLSCSGTTANIAQENGATAAFTTGGGCSSGTWSPAAPRYIATLTHNGDGTWTFVRQARDTYTFNSSGQLTGVTDLNGYSTTLAYSGGNLSTITDPAGRSLSLTWTGSHITQVTDSNLSPSRTVQYQYNDGSGNLTDVYDLGGNHWHFVYDGSHRMTSMLDPTCVAAGATCNSGNGIQTHYDSSGRVDWQKDQLGRQTSFDYSSISNATKVTDPKGNVQVEYYNQGLRVAETKGYGTPQSATWRYGFDTATLALTQVLDANGNSTTITVDANGNPLTVTDPLGRQRTRTYNSLNEPLTDQDGNGVTTTYTYDAKGTLTKSSRPLTGGAFTQDTTYNHTDGTHPGDVTSMVDPDSQTWTYGYDANGYRNSTTDPLGNQATSTFNAVGWLTSSVSPKGNVAGCGCAAQHTTTHSYTSGGVRNDFGDLISSSDPLGHGATRHYDADRNLVTLTDAKGNVTTYVYDLANEMTLTKRADTPQTTLTTDYNTDGTALDQKDGKNNAIQTYGYDSLARVTTITDALSNVTTLTYDGNGNLLTKQDPGGNCGGAPATGCATRAYDADNELTSVTYSDGVTPNMSNIQYDSDGQRTAITDGTGSSAWVWDSLHRLTSYTNGHSDQVQYKYNLRNLVTKIAYPTGNCGGVPALCVTRGYDNAGRWTSVQDWNANSTTFGYDANSNLTAETLPSGSTVVDTSTFDAADRLMSMSVRAGTTDLAPFPVTYARDAVNQLTSDSSATINQGNYKYTPLSQVCYAGSGNSAACSSPPGGSQPFSFDAADNMTTFGGTTQQFNAGNQLCWTYNGSSANACASPPAGASTYAYDNRGNRTASTPASGSSTCDAYDQGNRLTSIKTGSGSSCTSPATVGTYAYNGDGLRTSKTVGGTTTQFAWDVAGGLPLLLQEKSGANAPTYYVYGPGGLVLEELTSPAAITQVGTPATASDPNGTGGSLTMNLPASLQAGDQIVLATTYPAGVNNNASTPSGYTQVGSPVNSGGTSATADVTQVFRKSAASGDTSVTLNYSGPFPKAAVVTVYRGVDPTAPIDVASQGTTASGTTVSASTTTRYPNDQLLLVQGATYTATGTGSWSAPASMTERGQKDATSTTIGLADSSQANYGSTGSLSSTFTASGTTFAGPQLTAVLIGLRTPPSVVYYHHDQLGSTRLLTDRIGAANSTYTYDPYGNLAAQSGTFTTPLLYTGQYKDAESGLYYLRARYYDPGTGQFISRDPLVTTTRSPYAYVNDNPLNATDPTGLFCFEFWDASKCGNLLTQVEQAVAPAVRAIEPFVRPAEKAVTGCVGLGLAASRVVKNLYVIGAACAVGAVGNQITGWTVPTQPRLSIQLSMSSYMDLCQTGQIEAEPLRGFF